MSNFAKRILDQLYAQRNEHHVSIYIPHSSEECRRGMLVEAIAEAESLLLETLRRSEVERLLSPIRLLLGENRRDFSNVKDNIAIFRTNRLFRIISVPISVPAITVVSKSFHLKPLMRWAQADHSFLLVGVDSRNIHLYRGNLQSIQRMEASPLPPLLPPKGTLMSLGKWYLGRGREQQKREALFNFSERLSSWVPNLRTKIFFAGTHSDCALLAELAPKLKVQRSPISQQFQLNRINQIHQLIREALEKKNQQRLQQILLEYYEAEEQGLGSKDIKMIAQQAAMGNVKRLFIAHDVHLWGRFDISTGCMTLRPAQLDTQDEDVLDDLAELVRAKGGEVLVSPISNLPKQRPALAILKTTQQTKHSTVARVPAEFQLAVS
jgi:hypothetical protein